MRSFRIDKDQYVLKQARQARRILHIGCTCSPSCERRWRQGDLLHKQLCDQARQLDADCQITGIDIDRESLDFLREKMPGEEIFYADAHELETYLPGRRFDLIIAGDVIEHLENPGQFLTSCAAALAPDGKLLVTTINTFGIARFAKALLNREAVHSEHTAYFSRSTLKRLCSMCGLSMTTFGYCAGSIRLNRGSVSGTAGAVIEAAFAWLWPQFSEGLVIVAEVQAVASPATEPTAAAD